MMDTRVVAGKALDLPGMYPDVFATLDAEQARIVEQTFASLWHEGWEPRRSHVELLAERVTGQVSKEEYATRARQIVATEARQ